MLSVYTYRMKEEKTISKALSLGGNRTPHLRFTSLTC